MKSSGREGFSYNVQNAIGCTHVTVQYPHSVYQNTIYTKRKKIVLSTNNKYNKGHNCNFIGIVKNGSICFRENKVQSRFIRKKNG